MACKITELTALRDLTNELFNALVQLDDNSRESQHDLNLMAVALASMAALVHNITTR